MVCDRVEECDGLDKLEQLQQHESDKIYGAAFKIIDEFFHDENDESGAGIGVLNNQSAQMDGNNTDVKFMF